MQYINGNGSGVTTFGDVHVYNYYHGPNNPDPLDDNKLELARRHLDTLPLDVIPDPDPTRLPTGSRMFRRHNRSFVARESEFQTLAKALKGGNAYVIFGLPGIGKTELAVEFVYRYGQYFDGGVFWLDCGDPRTIDSQVAECHSGKHLGLPPDFGNKSPAEQAQLVWKGWYAPLPRLLVFDNCDDPTLLGQWLPTMGGCRVLVTSHRSEWDPALNVTAKRLSELRGIEGIDLLRRYRQDLSANDQNLSDIVAELDGLPLALRLAGNFLKRYKQSHSPADYLRELRQLGPIRHSSLESEDRSESVFRSFELNYKRLDGTKKLDKRAMALLARAAFLAPGAPIPSDILLNSLEVGEQKGGRQESEGALRRLLELGFIETDADENTVRLHRLLAAFVKDYTIDSTAQPDVEHVLLETAKRLNASQHAVQMRMLEPHIRAAIGQQTRDNEVIGRLATEFGTYWLLVSAYDQAQDYFEKSLAIYNRTANPPHSAIAECFNGLAIVWRARSNYKQARIYYEQAIEFSKKVKTVRTSATPRYLAALADMLGAQGDYDTAQSLLEDGLRLNQKTRSPDNRTMALTLRHLAKLLYDRGGYAKATPLCESAVELSEQAWGGDHPETAASYNVLAGFLLDQGRYDEACEYYERVAAIRESHFGPEHPITRSAQFDIVHAKGQKRMARQPFLVFGALVFVQIIMALTAIHPVQGITDVEWLCLIVSWVQIARGLWLKWSLGPVLLDLDITMRLIEKSHYARRTIGLLRQLTAASFSLAFVSFLMTNNRLVPVVGFSMGLYLSAFIFGPKYKIRRRGISGFFWRSPWTRFIYSVVDETTLLVETRTILGRRWGRYPFAFGKRAQVELLLTQHVHSHVTSA